MNPHTSPSVTVQTMVQSCFRNRQLISQMARRDVVGRYKGGSIGMAWPFITPVLMLSVYTIVFSVVFKSRWGGDANESKTQFALVLFVGMIVHGLFAEIFNRAPSLILNNVNYVKKVVFPLEVLPIVATITALFHGFVSFLVLLIAFAIFSGYLNWTAVFFPVVLLPLVVLTLGFAWFLASLGVFVRDVAQTTTIVTTVMMFLSPVFYPMSALPHKFQAAIKYNPLTFIIEQSRAVIIWGRLPDWQGLAGYSALALLFAWAGYAWFQKTRKGFADVL